MVSEEGGVRKQSSRKNCDRRGSRTGGGEGEDVDRARPRWCWDRGGMQGSGHVEVLWGSQDWIMSTRGLL